MSIVEFRTGCKSIRRAARWTALVTAASLLLPPVSLAAEREKTPERAKTTSEASVVPASSGASTTSATPVEVGRPPLETDPLAGFVSGTRPANVCRSGPVDASSGHDFPVVETSRPGPWRSALKLDAPAKRVPGQHGGEVLSPQGPASQEVDTTGRWVPGYRPATPQAQAEFEQWKSRERLKQFGDEAITGRRAPAGSPAANLLAGGRPTGEPAGEEEIQYAVRDQHYVNHPIDLRGPLTVVPEKRRIGEEETESSYEPHTGLTWDEYLQLKQDAANAPPTPAAQEAQQNTSRAPGGAGVSFVAIPSDFTSTPPDPIMAVGPNDVVAIVNARYRVWDKTGTPRTSAITLNTFFNGVANCSDVFDVFVDYDEQNDRFVMGGMTLSGSVDSYLCVAASKTNDPTGTWNRYSFRSDAMTTSTAMDYPHMGIGLDAVYIAGNMFLDTGAFNHIRLFALDKSAMYAGSSLTVAEANVGGSFFTAQPVKLHGYSSGGWPLPGTPHHFIAGNLAGVTRVWRWINPFSTSPTVYGDIAETFNGAPPLAPELGDTGNDQNDTGGGSWFDAEYRDGMLWATRGVGCNVGGGSAEACVDWIRVDVSGSSPVLQEQQTGGAYGSADDFRYYPDVSVDRNDNIAIGYTKSSASTYTEVWVTGREFSDPAGTLQAETLQHAGTGNYTDGAGCNGTCDRWGDYTGMSVDPDGCTFWYLGEYSDGGSFNWSTHIGSYQFASCSVDSSLKLDKGTYTCDDTLTVTVQDTTRISASTVSAQTLISTTGDSEVIPPASWAGSDCVGADCGTWTATLAVSGSAGSNNDGAINVADGGTITAMYTDPHGGHSNQTRTAGVTCQTRFDDGGYLIDGGCEDGTGTEMYRDYMDGGEYIAYSFGIYNPQSAPALTDVEATLSVTGPASSKVTIFNPTVYIGPVGQGTLTAPVFQVFVDPTIDTAGLRLSLNDFNLSVTSAADGYTVPQMVTQPQYLQADDNITHESQCFNFESAAGFVHDIYDFSYSCGAAEGCVPARTVNTVPAPWTRGSGCLSETRSDYPEMSCDVNGSNAFKTNTTAGSCGNFAQGTSSLTDDILYSPIITPAHTGNAGNGQPWNFQWLYAEWFYRSNMEVSANVPASAWGHFWSTDYQGVSTPATNEIDSLYDFFYGYYFYPNQTWDSGTAWDPDNPPANYDGAGFSTDASGLATSGMQWRWALEMFDADFGTDPAATAATPGMAVDDMNLVYDQYHAQEQVGTCSAASAVGTVSFDQFSYEECGDGTLGVTVLDGNAGSSVTVTVTSDGTGDSETFAVGGPGPYYATTLPYSTSAGGAVDDGTLFVTPSDVVRMTYNDSNPSGTDTASAVIRCPGGDVVVDGVTGFQDNGDHDTYADTNEVVDIALRIRNNTDQDLHNVVAYIATDDPDVECLPKNVASFGTITANGGTAVNDLGSDPFTFKVASGAECVDPQAPPSADFRVFIVADDFSGPSTPQSFSMTLDLNDLPGTVTYNQDFTTQPASFVHQLGPGDDDGVSVNPDSFACSPYSDRFFWRGTGGNSGGAFFCWQNPADNFPNGDYGDLSDSELLSPVFKIGATSTTLSFDDEYQFGSTSTLLPDGARVDYRVNGGAWQKLQSLNYDGALIFNSYCNPLCNGGWNTPCFSENTNDGEQIFALTNSGTQNWTPESGAVTGLTSGDQVQFRWRVGSMNSSVYGIPTTGGYGLDNVSVTNVVEQACDAAVNPDTGCNVRFKTAGNLVEVCGDGDATVEPTEIWTVDVTLENLKAASAVNTTADLEVNAGSAVAATISGNPGSYGTLTGSGGTGTDNYQFEVDAGAPCGTNLLFDVTNIADDSGGYPDSTAAFAIPVGTVTGSETANQTVSPLSAKNSLTASSLGPAFTLASPVDTGTVSYAFGYDNTGASESATQDTAPINATNGSTASTLSPAFTVSAGQAASASVDWGSLTYGGGNGNATDCARVSLRTPDATDVILKDLGVAAAPPYDVLSTYQGANGGPGQYSIVLEERQGGGCNGTAALSGTTMSVDAAPSTGSWTANARVLLWDGSSATILKDFGVADANPYDVASIYNAAGPGSYELRLEENNGGGTAQLTSGSMMIQTVQCDLGCSGIPAAPPMADGMTGNSITLDKGAGPDDVVITIDNATCSADHAVVLYGDIGNFSSYQGAVSTNCNLGAGPTGTVTQSGNAIWFNVIWVNSADAGGHPGYSSAGARTWTASGLCGVTSDDQSDGVCN